MGASVAGIVRLLSIDFAKTVVIAAVIALPIAYVAIVVMLLLAMLTVSFQTIKTSMANPTDSLKQE